MQVSSVHLIIRSAHAMDKFHHGDSKSALAKCNIVTYEGSDMLQGFSPNAAFRRNLDKTGIAVSAMCAMHCVLTMVLVSGLGFGAQFILSEQVHRITLAMALVIAVFAIGWGVFLHRRRQPFLIAAIGLFFMGSALFAEHGLPEALLTIAGVALVSTGHLLNLRASR